MIADLATGIVEAVGIDTLTGIENLVGSEHRDVIAGNDQANVIRGGPGADRITGAGGGDTLMGGKGPDSLDGGPGDDFLDGGPHERSALELQRPPPNFERLITLGAGLAKLDALQDLRHRSAFLTYWTIMRLLLIFVFLLTLGATEESVYADLSGVAGCRPIVATLVVAA